jgi:hypothetical protein
VLGLGVFLAAVGSVGKEESRLDVGSFNSPHLLSLL